MAEITRNNVDKELREQILPVLNLEGFTQTSNQSFKKVLTDLNGIERLVEIRIVVGKVEEERSPQERLEEEVALWEQKKQKVADQKKARADKAEKDRQKRLAKKKEQEEA